MFEHVTIPIMGTVDGAGDIYLWRPGAHLRRLLSSNEPRDQPAWSPNGKQIAFAMDLCTGAQDCTSGGRPEEVFVANSDGGSQRQLTFPASDELRSDYLSWSPDGRRVAFLRELDNYQRLEIVSVANGSTRVLPIHGNVSQAAWDKPGIAYLDRTRRSSRAPIAIRIADPHTGGSRPFASPATGYSVQSIAWSKQGDLAAMESSLAYNSRAENVTTYTRTGRQVSRFRIPKHWATCGITWSPSGTRLLLTVYRRGHINPKTRQPILQLYTVDPKGEHWQRQQPGLALTSCNVSWR